MSYAFKLAIQQTKIDASIGEKLLRDTEKFFKMNQEMSNILNRSKPFLKQSNQKIK